MKLFFQLAATDDGCLDETNLEWLESPTIQHIISTHMEARSSGSWDGKTPMFDRFEHASEKSLIAKSVTEQRPIPKMAEQYRQILDSLRDGYLYRTLPIRIKHPATAEEDRAKYLAQYLELKKRAGKKPDREILDRS